MNRDGRFLNYTTAAVLLLALFYFGGRIYVAFASGRVQQIVEQPTAQTPPIASEEDR